MDDNGFAIVPSLVKVAGGNVYLALLDICVQDSGEHYGTQFFFSKYGVVRQDELKKRLSKEECTAIFPYKYRPLVEIEDDYHECHYF